MQEDPADHPTAMGVALGSREEIIHKDIHSSNWFGEGLGGVVRGWRDSRG